MEDLYRKYSALNLSDKRNELNKELVGVLILLNQITKQEDSQYFNYDQVSNASMNEEGFLVETYMQIFDVRNKILSIINNEKS